MAFFRTNQPMQPISGQIRLDFPGESSTEAELAAPVVCSSQGATFALRGQCRLGDHSIKDEVGASKVLEAYQQSGAAFLSDLRGPFALVITLPEEKKVLIAIDRMGIERLTWARQGDSLAVGTSAEHVARQLWTTPQIRPQAIFDFMLGHMIPSPYSIFEGVEKLGPAMAVEFTDGRAEPIHYWQPDFNRPSDTNIDDLAQSVRPTLLKAIEKTQPDAMTGSFLSGGLDSSTVTGLLAQANTASASAFSVGFGVAEFDEMEFADTASGHFSCQHHKYEVTADDIVEAIPKIAAAYDEPFGNSSAVPTYYCARLAKQHGVTHLLAGDGGDEIFGGNERYVRHRIFEIYAKIPRFLRTALLDPAARALDPETSLFPFRKFSSYVRQAQIPLPERFESWNLIYREGPERVFSKEFLGRIDPEAPLRHMTEVWDACPSADLLDHMLWYDWKFTLADNDIRKVSTMCELAGVRVSYPMLEEDFVDLSIRVPSNQKISGNELRSFFKNSVRDFLPEKIISKQKHGFGLPFGQWLKTHAELQDLVYTSIDTLPARGLFHAELLDRVTAEHREGHASYYGYAIWDLVMLEQWFQHHIAPASF
jgi:asparagine synthase (glutamine-hydrolysing)